ncbi:hypothetical protein [Owenweeksia hongkongensis]|uniref:hypothetical protein n=1 Tax=Owenweeksia hongkongensis TaxID=253245 RepID=UPI003A8E1692
MKISFSLFLFITISLHSFSQVDYIDFKERYSLSCGVPGSAIIVKNQILIDSLQPFEITNDEMKYLYDYGWVYKMRYMKWKNIDDLRIAVSSFEAGWKQYQDLTALWNLGTLYRPLGDCEKALDYTELYLEKVSGSVQVDYKQIYYRYKYCRGKE